MYNRFKDSILFPQKLLDYRNDKLLLVFLYILIFALLLSTRPIIDVITFDSFSITGKNIVSENFNVIDQSCTIEQYNVECDNNQSMLFYEDIMLYVYIDSSTELDQSLYTSGYNIVLHEDTAYIYFAGIRLLAEPLENFGDLFEDIDFSLQNSDVDTFNNQLFTKLESYAVSTKAMWGTALIIGDIIQSIILFLFFILISSWMLRWRFKVIKFRQLFAMTTYSSTPLYVVLILNSLYSFSMFIVFILLIVAFIQNNKLSNEILRRLQQKKP